MEAQGFVFPPKGLVREKDWYEKLKPIIDETVKRKAATELLTQKRALDMLSEQFGSLTHEYILQGMPQLEAENMACKEVYGADINGNRIVA